MYPKDVTDSPLTRSSQMRSAKWVAVFIVLFIIIVYARIQAGAFTYKMPYASPILNIIAVLLYINLSMTIARQFIAKEKSRLKELDAAISASSLDKYSKLDLKSDVASNYKYTRNIYMPEIEGLKTVFIQFTHFSQLDNPAPNQEMMRGIFNYCMRNALVLSRYDMNQGDDLASLRYKSEQIKQSDLPPEALRRASFRLDYQRTICENSRVTTEIVQISATNMSNNLRFLEHVKIILSQIDKAGTSYAFDVLSRDQIIDFLKEYYCLDLIGLPELASNTVDKYLAAGVALQKDFYANGEEKEYFQVALPIKKFKRIRGVQR